MKTKNKGKHFNFEQRKLIVSFISKDSKLKEIADYLGFDPTSISKEVKRNRILDKKARFGVTAVCKKLDRWPYVCNNCPKRYTSCPMTQYRYKAVDADKKASKLLIESRQGIDMSEEEFKNLDDAIKEGINNKESIYHITMTDERVIRAPSTVYHYINTNKLTIKKIDLPYAIKYKKRKIKKEYDYPDNKINRDNRTYLDYLSYKRHHANEYEFQLDFLGSIRTDSNYILTLTIPFLHFVLLFLIKNPDSKKVTDVFDNLERRLGTQKFKEIFPFGLTDRDPCFANFQGIEFNDSTGEQRTHLFYCDPYNSSQKGNVENMNKQLRKYFPKGKSIEHLTEENVREVNHIILTRKVESLGGASPEEAFIKVYGLKAYNSLFKL